MSTLPFGQTHARTDDPATSRVAADNAETFAGTHMEIVRQGLERFPDGATQSELAEILPLTREQINRRLPDLERDAQAVVTGNYRNNVRGLPEQVYRIARPGDQPRERRPTVTQLQTELETLRAMFADLADAIEARVADLEASWPK